MDKIVKKEDNNLAFVEAVQMFREFSVKSEEYAHIPPKDADNRDFGSEFPGSLIEKPRYNNCRFNFSRFKASNGAFSIFNVCKFYDCFFSGANFNYCNFSGCDFERKEKFLIENTGFNFSQFINVNFKKIRFEGVSFRDIYLENSTFNACDIKDSSFERAIIKNTKFTNMDLRNIGIRYCRFHDDVKFDNIIFPILDLVTNIGLSNIFEKNVGSVKFSLGNKKEVDFVTAKELIFKLIPYYMETRQYFSVLNIYLINKQTEKISYLLPKAIDYSIKQEDFDSLYNICQFIANVGLFNKKELHKIYNIIKSEIQPDKVPYNVKKGYINYIDEIKNILLNNSNEYPCATIELTTNIKCNEPENLTPIVIDTEKVIRNINPDITSKIEISHHSPYELFITIFGKLHDILTICQIFYYSFGGVKAIKDIENSRHEKASNKHNEWDNENLLTVLRERNPKVFEEKVCKKLDYSIGPIKFQKKTKTVIKSVEYYIN